MSSVKLTQEPRLIHFLRTETTRTYHCFGARDRKSKKSPWVAILLHATREDITDRHRVSRPKEDADEIVSKHIKLLHQYNETKDATQVRRI